MHALVLPSCTPGPALMWPCLEPRAGKGTSGLALTYNIRKRGLWSSKAQLKGIPLGGGGGVTRSLVKQEQRGGAEGSEMSSKSNHLLILDP